MSLFDRLRRGFSPDPENAAELETSGMSRRDFFARFAGRDAERDPGEQTLPADEDNGVLHTFLVKGFPYHSGPVLVPILRVGDEYRLTPEPPYSPNPTAVRIERGRDLLGYVPDEYVSEILSLLKERVPLVCRATQIDTAAELARILTVEIARVPPDPEVEGAGVGRASDSPTTLDDGALDTGDTGVQGAATGGQANDSPDSAPGQVDQTTRTS